MKSIIHLGSKHIQGPQLLPAKPTRQSTLPLARALLGFGLGLVRLPGRVGLGLIVVGLGPALSGVGPVLCFVHLLPDIITPARRDLALQAVG